jgi:hypothetical protein
LSINNSATDKWSTFQVVQEIEDGPFQPERVDVDPSNVMNCLPLVHLGQMDAGWCSSLINGIGRIPVPGEAASWNCQDYVMEIWEMMRNMGMVDEEAWSIGKAAILIYYRQDYGESEGEDHEELEDEEDGNEGTEHGANKAYPLSEEYVYNSESSWESAH